MSTNVFVSPEGGVGKTTAALLLASELMRAVAVKVVGADPNDPIAAWAKGGAVPANLPVFDTQLNESEALRAVFSFQQALENLDPREVSGLDKAQANAEQFAAEVIERLRAARISNQTETAR